MIRSPATPGTIGQLLSLHLVAAIYARPRNRATSAAAAARAGHEMLKKFNIKSIKNESRKKTKKYKSTSKEETGPTHKSTSLQAPGRRKQDHKLRVQASSLSLQAPGFWSQGTSAQALEPGYKQPGQKYFFYA